MKLWLLYFCLIFSFLTCQHKSENLVHKDSSTQALKREFIRQNTFEVIALNTESRNELRDSSIVNLKKPIFINSEWLEKAKIYKNDTLPLSLAQYFQPLVCHNLEEIIFTFLEGNLDEDADNELILFFYVPCYGTNLLSVILNKKDNLWYIITLTKHVTRDDFKDMIPEIDYEEKILICKSGFWGSGLGGINHHFYKFINNKYQEVLDLPSSSYHSIVDSFSGLSSSHNIDYYFLNSYQIRVNYKYNLFWGDSVSIIKDRNFIIDLIWKRESNAFEQKSNYFDLANMKRGRLHYLPHLKLFKDELIYLSKYGTPAQIKALTWYRMGNKLN